MTENTIIRTMTTEELEQLVRFVVLLTKVSVSSEALKKPLYSVKISFTQAGSTSQFMKENWMHWRDTNLQVVNGLVSVSGTEHKQL